MPEKHSAVNKWGLSASIGQDPRIWTSDCRIEGAKVPEHSTIDLVSEPRVRDMAVDNDSLSIMSVKYRLAGSATFLVENHH